MLHTCVQRFDVTKNLKNFTKFFGTKLGQRRTQNGLGQNSLLGAALCSVVGSALELHASARPICIDYYGKNFESQRCI
jgi:hypothetical protein